MNMPITNNTGTTGTTYEMTTTTAARWGISVRHVQWLAKHGHIPGALWVAAGARGYWLIPDNACRPVLRLGRKPNAVASIAKHD